MSEDRLKELDDLNRRLCEENKRLTVENYDLREALIIVSKSDILRIAKLAAAKALGAPYDGG